jgi:hypothetical protein
MPQMNEQGFICGIAVSICGICVEVISMPIMDHRGESFARR